MCIARRTSFDVDHVWRLMWAWNIQGEVFGHTTFFARGPRESRAEVEKKVQCTQNAVSEAAYMLISIYLGHT